MPPIENNADSSVSDDNIVASNDQDSGDSGEEVENNSTDTTETPEADPVETRLKAFEDSINNALNRVMAKVDKKLKALPVNPPSTESTSPKSNPKSDPKTSDAKPPESINQEQLTLEALRSELAKEREERRKELEKMRLESEKDKRNSFLAQTEAKIATAIAGKKFSDPDAAMTVFKSMHNPDFYHQGSEGYVIYKRDEDDDGVTLEKLIDDWSKSSVGKHFIKVNVPNGTGSIEPATPKNQTTKNNTKKLTYKEIKQGINNGTVGITTDY